MTAPFRKAPPTPANRYAVDLGERYTEMNMILRRIRHRASGEPTTKERDRLAVLKRQITNIKAGREVDE